jgi:hypothetical protein
MAIQSNHLRTLGGGTTALILEKAGCALVDAPQEIPGRHILAYASSFRICGVYLERPTQSELPAATTPGGCME